MNRLKSASPTRPTALSTYIRASLLGLSSLALVAFPMVSHADLTPSQQDLTKLYLASFLRAPDLGGLNYWNAQLTAGSSLQTVGGIIFSIPIVRDIYPQGMSDKAFVEAIYGNVFQRESDPEGLNYWMKELANLRTYFDLTITDGLSAERARGQLVMNMINAGLGTPDGTAGKASIVNRLNVAKLAAEEQIKRGVEIPPEKLKTIGACVNSNASSTTTALDEIQNFYNPSYKLGGTVTGLTIEIGLSVKYGCGKVYNISSNGAFTLPEGFAPGVGYSVSINSQPKGQECTVANGVGKVAYSDVNAIGVSCVKTTVGSDIKTGYFFDAPVEGLNFLSCNSTKNCLVGVTGKEGEYKYRKDDIISISIGGLSINESTAAAMTLVPTDLLGEGVLNNRRFGGIGLGRVVNADQNIATPKTLISGEGSVLNESYGNKVAQLLQSLDEDGNPLNGISIPEYVNNNAFLKYRLPTSFDSKDVATVVSSVFPGRTPIELQLAIDRSNGANKLALLAKGESKIAKAILGEVDYNPLDYKNTAPNPTAMNISKLDSSMWRRVYLELYYRNITKYQSQFDAIKSEITNVERARKASMASFDLIKSGIESGILVAESATNLEDAVPMLVQLTKAQTEYYNAGMISLSNGNNELMSDDEMQQFVALADAISAKSPSGSRFTPDEVKSYVNALKSTAKVFLDDTNDVTAEAVGAAINCGIAYADSNNKILASATCVNEVSNIWLKGAVSAAAAWELFGINERAVTHNAIVKYLDSFYRSAGDGGFMLNKHGVPFSVNEAAEYFYKSEGSSFDKDMFKKDVVSFFDKVNAQAEYYMGSVGYVFVDIRTNISVSGSDLIDGYKVNQGGRLDFDFNFDLPSGYSIGTVSWFAQGGGERLPYKMTFSPSGGARIIFYDAGNYTVGFSVVIHGASGEELIVAGRKSIVVLPVNLPPILAVIPNQTATVGKQFYLDLSQFVSSNGGQSVTYVVSGQPSGFTLNNALGHLYGTPVASGSYVVTAMVRNQSGSSVERQFALVIQPPVDPTKPTGKLNDTGIVTCGTPSTAGTQSNSLNCTDPAAATPAQQDGMNGRDYAAQQGTLTKVGGSTPNYGNINGFDFTKIGSNGQPLAIQTGTLDSNGSEAAGTKWDCVRDNVTGLLWENKSYDSGLHTWNSTYSWYNSNSATNGGYEGKASSGDCLVIGRCDTEKFVADVNAAGLCGHNDWRMPTMEELHGIADLGQRYSAIDTGYFLSTLFGYYLNSYYWSGSTFAVGSDRAWFVDAKKGYASTINKGNNAPVRLVRGQ